MKLRNMSPETRIYLWMEYVYSKEKLPRKLKKHIFGKTKRSQRQMQRLSDKLNEES